jgi:transposase
VIADGSGIPLAVALTGGHRNDVTHLLPLLDAVPPVPGKIGCPRSRPAAVYADRGYDHDKYRRLLWAKGIRPMIARRGTGHSSGLGTVLWVIERTIAWLHGFRRLRIRFERRDDIHEAFLGLATCLIILRHVEKLC